MITSRFCPKWISIFWNTIERFWQDVNDSARPRSAYRKRTFGSKYAVCYQPLERRELLAGNVTATFDNGILHLIGDFDDNAIVVQHTGIGVTSVIGNNNTTINGESSFSFFARRLEKLNIEMRIGNDNIILRDLTVQQEINIDGGEGDNFVSFENVLSRRANVVGGSGNDVAQIAGANFRKSVAIDLADGNNVLAIGALNVKRNLTIETGSGNDTLATDYLNASRSVTINTGAGNDYWLIAGDTLTSPHNPFKANLGDGNDVLLAHPSLTGARALIGNAQINLGAGDDILSIDAATWARGTAKIFGDSGTDTINNASPDTKIQISGFNNQTAIDVDALVNSILQTLQGAGIDVSRYQNSL